MAHEQIVHDHHPGPRTYVVIALLLAILTAAEVGAFLISGVNPALMTTVLLSLSFAKFVMVLGFFMHLKFDDNRFTLLFAGPFVVMVSIAVAVLALFANVTR
jgi:cytochrome c oxidase subunit 4